ncbi:hypothetical protein FHX57_006759 [Paraburkholderia tropica]|nr:hypothetical protein [Paraburkholderia tropica]
MNWSCLVGQYWNACARNAWLWSRWADDWVAWYLKV